jgi:hypothetical protein
MKHTLRTTLFLLLAVAMALSACAPLATQVPTPTAGTTAVPTATALPPTATASPSPSPLPPTAMPLSPTPTPGATATAGPTEATWQTYRSFTYNYRVNYPAGWTAQVNTSFKPGSGKLPEYVTFASGPNGSLPSITIYALTGAPPFTGYENCPSNLVFKGLAACRVLSPAAQSQASEALVFHNGDQYFQFTLLYQGQAALGLFDLLTTSFQFTGAVAGGPTLPVMKNFGSKLYAYSVNYPTGWSVKVDTSATAGSGQNPEYVTFTPGPNGSLVNIAIYALSGAAPFTGYEACD